MKCEIENLPNEEWKVIEGFERYMVSNMWRIKSLIGKPKLLKPFITSGGYLMVKLSKNRKAYNRRIHRIVAIAFVETDNKSKEVHHVNENILDNRASNLQWLSKEEHTRLHCNHSSELRIANS